MAYFSGAESVDYSMRWCDRCIHGQDPDVGCPVFFIHLQFNCDQCRIEPIQTILSALIPMDDDGLVAMRCSMFKAAPDVDHQGDLF